MICTLWLEGDFLNGLIVLFPVWSVMWIMVKSGGSFVYMRSRFDQQKLDSVYPIIPVGIYQ